MAVYGTEKFNGDIINLLGKEFKVAAAEKIAVSKDSYMSSMYSGVYYVSGRQQGNTCRDI